MLLYISFILNHPFANLQIKHQITNKSIADFQ